MDWTVEQIKKRLREIKAKGFIGIPPEMFRKDDGIVGQLLEREFQRAENNLRVRDLGTFELKGMRLPKKKGKAQTLTLSHKKPEQGMTPIEIYNRFGYVKPSNRDSSILKRKLFTTVKGRKPNNLGLRLRGESATMLDMVFGDEILCKWDLTVPLEKIDQIILGLADTRGERNAPDEEFHYTKALMLNGLRDLKDLIDNDVIVIDFCIDQPASLFGIRQPHDRGPHIRVLMRKLTSAYKEVIPILE